MRKSYTAEFKAKVALEATKADKSLAEIASKYDVHPNNEAKLFEEIGRLKVEVDWLKKKI